MNSPEPPDGRKPNPILDVGISVAIMVGVCVVGVVLVAALSGIFLDRLIGTRPLFTILFVVGACPISLYLVYRVAQNAVSKIPMPPGKYPRGDYKDEGGQDE